MRTLQHILVRCSLTATLAMGSLALATAQPQLPTPAPPPTVPSLDRPVFAPAPPRPPKETPPIVDALGRIIAPIYQTISARTRPDTPDSDAPAEGITQVFEWEDIGQIGTPVIMPFGSRGERVAIAFRSGDFVPPAGEKIQPALRLLAAQRAQTFTPVSGNARPVIHALILFSDHLTEDIKHQLESAGVEFHGFYPYNAYQARIPIDVLEQLETIPIVRWVGMPEPVQKLDPALLPLLQKRGSERVLLYINLIGPDTSGTAKASLNASGMSVYTYHRDLCFYFAEGDAQAIWNALSMDSVLFIEPVPLSRVAHFESQPSVNADRLWGTEFDGRPYAGRQIRIGVMDSGMNRDHPDFRNLVGGMFGFNHTAEENWWNDLNGHGTSVSGTFFGQGHLNYRYRGFASGFQESPLEPYDLVHSKVFRRNGYAYFNSVGEGLEDMRGRGINGMKRHLFNYSGGAPGVNLTGTDAQSRIVDLAFTEDILPVIAAGNTGSNAGTINIPGVAKGALTVGNVYDDGEFTVDTLSEDSSRGPTGDGRIKPEVVAPGREIISTTRTGGYHITAFNGGTSHATPHVAGLAATLKLRYNLPAAAIRSIILATAINLGHPRNSQGFGKVDALLAHHAWNGGWYTVTGNNGPTGDLRFFDVNIPASATRVRIVLVYPDPPASAGASVALVNDLDLIVQDGFFTTDTSGMLFPSSGNVEFAELGRPAAGFYRIKIHSRRIVQGNSQPWAVTIHWTNGSQSPNVNLTLSVPIAVKPNFTFTVNGSASAGSYVASSVYAKLTAPLGGLNVGTIIVYRRSPNGGEEFDIPVNLASGKNLGNIGHTLSRRAAWHVTSQSSEGSYPLQFTVRSRNGGSRTIHQNVVVDGTPPVWNNFHPASGWTNNRTPTCSIIFHDRRAGMNLNSVLYWYSTPTTGVRGPFPASFQDPVPAPTDPIRFYAYNIPFNRDYYDDSAKVKFAGYDRAGNYVETPWQVVKIDTVPPGNWHDFRTLYYSRTEEIFAYVRVQDIHSGLDITQAYYRYSLDGGVSWTSWTRATSIYGTMGTTSPQRMTGYIRAVAGPNVKVQFSVRDVAGNIGYSPIYTANR